MVPALWNSTSTLNLSLLSLLIFLAVLQRSVAPPYNLYDVYKSSCRPVPQSPAPSQWASGVKWKAWSDPQTWPGKVVPGVGKKTGMNVTIPCDWLILLDVPHVSLNLLLIRGTLRVKDAANVGNVHIQASFIVVEGVFSAGESGKQFSRSLSIELRKNPNGKRTHLAYHSLPPADAKHPRDLGHKVLAVVGGALDLHGMPGGKDTPSWCFVADSVPATSRVVPVTCDVSSWQPGMRVAISSTDYDPFQAQEFGIVDRFKDNKGVWNIRLDTPLKYSRFGDYISDGFGGKVLIRAEIALLTRNIKISGEDEPKFKYEGGHVIVYFTQRPQIVEGVEFMRMGQQGIEDRFSLFFKFSGNMTQGKSDSPVCRKNSFHDILQRCVVLQATSGMLIEHNVAYNTSGHCYDMTDGAEVENTLRYNLGFVTRMVDRPLSRGDERYNSATFRVTNPYNFFYGNVGGGGNYLGMWWNLNFVVTGESANRPDLNNWLPFFTEWGEFKDFILHSYWRDGAKAWPYGAYPRKGAMRSLFPDYPNKVQWMLPRLPADIKNFTFYKLRGTGFFADTGDQIVISDSFFADCWRGIYRGQLSYFRVERSRFVGISTNYGTPYACTAKGTYDCAPREGCKWPLSSNAEGRSTGVHTWNHDIFGIAFDQYNHTEPGDSAPQIIDCSFAFYESNCRVAAALGVGITEPADWWNPTSRSTGMRLYKANPIFMAPPYKFNLGEGYSNPGPPALWYAWQDVDGSIVGKPGFIVTNASAILRPPTNVPSAIKCIPKPQWFAYACPGVCLRAISIDFREDDWTPRYNSPNMRARGSYTYMRVTRVEDGVTMYSDGNLNSRFIGSYDNQAHRWFVFVLPADYTYEFAFLRNTSLPNGQPFIPKNITFWMIDAGTCPGGLTIRLLPFNGAMFKPEITKNFGLLPCQNPDAMPPSDKILWTYTCTKNGKQPALEMRIGDTWQGNPYLTRAWNVPPKTASCTPQLINGAKRCALVPMNAEWRYARGQRGMNAQYDGGPAFYNPLYPPAQSWPKGPANLGFYNNWNANGRIQTQIPNITKDTSPTYYFRTTFSLSNPACYSSLDLGLWVDDGIVFYINNQEVARANMPKGKHFDAYVRALTDTPPYNMWVWSNSSRYNWFQVPLEGKGSVQLVTGTNYVAVEQHAANWVPYSLGWEALISASLNLKPGCQGMRKVDEVCDGLDNDGDGKVDRDKAGRVLTAPCKSQCGTGVYTCINGAFQNCSAPPVKPEICNGIDDDCDGMVDNNATWLFRGLGVGEVPPPQLDCPQGYACFQGRCQQVKPMAQGGVPVWGQRAKDWLFYAKGDDLASKAPKWKSGVVPANLLQKGQGPLGLSTMAGDNDFKTTLPFLAKAATTGFFLKSFTLSAAELAQTFSMALNVRAGDGVVVYINGVEVHRWQMPLGKVNFNTLASSQAYFGTTGTASRLLYYPCVTCPFTSMKPFLKAGVNWVTAEVHVAYVGHAATVFDLNLTRIPIPTCPAPKPRRSLLSLPLSPDEEEDGRRVGEWGSGSGLGAGESFQLLDYVSDTRVLEEAHVKESAQDERGMRMEMSREEGDNTVSVGGGEGQRVRVERVLQSAIFTPRELAEKHNAKPAKSPPKFPPPVSKKKKPNPPKPPPKSKTVPKPKPKPAPKAPPPSKPKQGGTNSKASIGGCISPYKGVFFKYTQQQWRFLDGSKKAPASNWFTSDFDDSKWGIGLAPIGTGGWYNLKTKLERNNTVQALTSAAYFRTKFSAPDGPCFYNVTAGVLIHAGCVVYINGAEAFRVNMPSGPLNVTSRATDGGYWGLTFMSLSGRWLRAGVNTIAVAMHTNVETNPIFFDLELQGDREAVTCQPPVTPPA